MPGVYTRVSPDYVVDENGQQYYMPLDQPAPVVDMPPETVDPSGGPVPFNLAPNSFTLAPDFSGPPPGPGMPEGGLGTPRSPDQIMGAVTAATPPPRPAFALTPEEASDPALASAPPRGRGSQGNATPPPAPAFPRTREEVARGYAAAEDAGARAAEAEYRVKSQASAYAAEDARTMATEATKFGADYASAMTQATTRAWDRWASWKTKYDEAANAKVDPNKYWSDRSGLQKALWMMSVAAGAWTSSGPAGNGRNPALEMLKEAITRDINAQESNRDFKMKALEGERAFIGEQNAMERQTLADKATAFNLRVDALIKVADARIKALGPSADAAAWERTKAELQQTKAENGARLFSDYNAEEQAKEQRRFSAAQAATERKFRAEEAEKDRQHARDMAVVKVTAEERARAAKEGDPDSKLTRISPRLGVTSKNRKDGRSVEGGVVWTDKPEQREAMADAAAAGNTKYTTLTRLIRAAEAMTDDELARGGTPDVKALFGKLALVSARVDQPGGVLTDQDVALGAEIVSGQKNAGAWETIKTPGELKEFLKKSLAGVEHETRQNIDKYADPDWDIDWKPQYVYPDSTEARVPTQREANAAIGGPGYQLPDEGRRKYKGDPLLDTGDAATGQWWLEKQTGTGPELPPAEESWYKDATAGLSNMTLSELDARADAVRAAKNHLAETKNRVLIEIKLARAKIAQRMADEQLVFETLGPSDRYSPR